MTIPIIKCWCCDAMLTEANNSKEHIISNACGGRLKSKWLLCKKCNKRFGERYDAELAQQLNPLVNYLMIKRERNEPQPIVGKLQSDGTEYKQLADGTLMRSNPDVSITKEGEKVQIRIAASNDKQFNEVINELVRKYPFLNKEEINRQATRTNYYLNEPIKSNMGFGGPNAFKSLTKTAINYYMHTGGNAANIKHLIKFLTNEEELEVVWYYFPDFQVYHPGVSQVTHLVHIEGCPREKILYAYIELFNAMNVLVKLSDDYVGAAVNETYCFDPVQRAEIDIKLQLSLSRNNLLKIFSEKSNPIAAIQNRLNRVFVIADKIQVQFNLNKIVPKEVKAVLESIPHGTVITPELYQELLSKIIDNVMPFVAHQQQRGQIIADKRQGDD